jgi:hypothetical protein
MKVINIEDSVMFNQKEFENTYRTGSTCPNCQCPSCPNCLVCHCVPNSDISSYIRSIYLKE